MGLEMEPRTEILIEMLVTEASTTVCFLIRGLRAGKAAATGKTQVGVREQLAAERRGVRGMG